MEKISRMHDGDPRFEKMLAFVPPKRALGLRYGQKPSAKAKTVQHLSRNPFSFYLLNGVPVADLLEQALYQGRAIGSG
jgi:hypothetical protein